MIATSLIPLDIILPEICVFCHWCSCTVWTKMRSLAGSLADGVLADTILIPPRPTAHQYMEGKGSSKKSTETSSIDFLGSCLVASTLS